MQIWNRDLDAMNKPSFFETLKEGTGLEIETMKAATLLKFEGHLFEKFNPNGNNDYILPLGLYHRTRRSFGAQFCPKCLQSDVTPFARLEWRLATTTFCKTHGTGLLDRCPKCSAPYIVHRGGFVACFSCKYDFRRKSPTSVSSKALQLEAMLTGTLHGDVALCQKLGSSHEMVTFSVIHWLLSMLASGARAHSFRLALHERFGGDLPDQLSFDGGLRVFEKLDVLSRRALISQVSDMCDDWPSGLIRSALKADLWRSWIIREHKLSELPFPIAKLLGTDIYPDHASIKGQKKSRMNSR
jgi:hypothetical protein